MVIMLIFLIWFHRMDTRLVVLLVFFNKTTCISKVTVLNGDYIVKGLCI